MTGGISDRFRVDGRVAIVTAAGRGLGAATAVALAQSGADLVISARSSEQLSEVAAGIDAAGRRVETVAADLSELEAIAGLVTVATDAFGRLDIVVNNLGGAMPRALIDTSPRYLEEAFHFNVATAHALLRAAVPVILGSGERDSAGAGSIVNVSSVVGRVAGRGYLAYGTAKAALAHYTRLAARDLAPRIRVNALAVGSAATSALEMVMADETMRRSMEQATPLRRIAEPEEIAAAAVFLASPAASYVTGKVLEVDGGLEGPNLDLGIPDLG